MEEVKIAQLKAHERAFRYAEDGPILKVCILSKKEHGDSLVIKFGTCEVDEQGAETNGPTGVPVRCPTKSYTVSLAAVAEGQLSVEDVIAEATAESVVRHRRHRVGLEAWVRIPSATTE